MPTTDRPTPWQALTSDDWRELAKLSAIEADSLRDWAELAAMRHGDVSTERAYHAAVKADQAAPSSMASAPDAYEGVRHSVVSKRSNSGRVARRVVRAGRAYVTGPDPFRPDTGDAIRVDSVSLTKMADAWIMLNDPAATEHECTCTDLTERVQRFRKGKPVMRDGAYAYDVRSLRACHCAPFPSLLGTELRSFAEIGPRDSFAHAVADHRTDIAGGLFSTNRDGIRRVIHGRRANGRPYVSTEHGPLADVVSDRRVATVTKLTWIARSRVSVRARQSDPVDSVNPATGVTELVAAHADRDLIWHGHKLVLRSAPKGRGSKGQTARRRAVKASAPWAPIAATIRAAMGEGSDSVEVNGVRITLGAPDAAGRFRATLAYCDGTTRTIRARTADPVARAAMV